MTEQYAQAVFDAGWQEKELHEAVLTVRLFNFMSRLLEGHGVKGQSEIYESRGRALFEQGYTTLLGLLKDEEA